MKSQSELTELFERGILLVRRARRWKGGDTRMSIRLVKIELEDAETIWKMQVKAFQDLLDKYQDFETNPAAEPVEKTRMRLKQPFTFFYYIKDGDNIVGAVRVVDKKEVGKAKRISPIFIMKEYRGYGYAQEAIKQVEEIHGCGNWELDTIFQEKGNCYLYEKMGYQAIGKIEKINENMSLICYKKR